MGGPILPPGAPKVLIGGNFPAARIGDWATCVGPLDTIAKGAFPVPINGSPAARKTDQTAHGGEIKEGCTTVLIGLAGTAGNVFVGQQICEAAFNGRKKTTNNPDGHSQNYNNCGIESSRQVINQAKNSNLTEDGLLQDALNNGWASRGAPPNTGLGDPPVPFGTPPRFQDGGSTVTQRQNLLNNYQVSSSVKTNNLDNIGQALSGGKGVIADTDAHFLWDGVPNINPPAAGSFHAVTVTGVEYDDNGNVTNVIVNDTGIGECSRKVPVDTWNKAVQGVNDAPVPNTNPVQHYRAYINVTSDPIF
ncbi:MAG: PAAR domain-containing protein [Polyangiaceae bacterium]|nr:PAAR domain-containing protein [Polyangiaceae bacterium]